MGQKLKRADLPPPTPPLAPAARRRSGREPRRFFFLLKIQIVGGKVCHQVCFVVGSAGCFCCRRWTCGSSRRLSWRASFLAMPANTQLSLFFAKTAGKEPRRWSGPTQLPHTRAEQLKRIVRRLLPSHGRARAKEPRHRTSEEQAVLEIQARALGLLMAFESGGEGKLRLRDCDLVHFMTTATESQPKSRRLVVVKAICCRSTAAGTLRGDQTLLKHSF